MISIAPFAAAHNKFNCVSGINANFKNYFSKNKRGGISSWGISSTYNRWQNSVLGSAVFFGALLFVPAPEVMAAGRLDVTTQDVTFSGGSQTFDAIDVSNNYTLKIENGAEVGVDGGFVEVGLGDSRATIHVTGANSHLDLLDSIALTLTLVDEAEAILLIEDGGRVSVNELNIAAGTNNIRVAGVGSVLDVYQILDMSVSGGPNSIVIEDGGAISIYSDTDTRIGATSNVFVTGNGSSLNVKDNLHLWTNAGHSSTMKIEGGGITSVGGNLYLAENGTGTFTVTGDNSWLTVGGNLSLGLNTGGAGSLLVQDGGNVIIEREAIIGIDGAGLISVTGENSRLNVHENLYLGTGTGSSMLSITDAGMVSVGSDIIVGGSGVSGINVIGADSKLEVNGSLSLGGDLYHSFFIGEGGVVSVGTDATIGGAMVGVSL
ncbi:hypothetical protein [Microbulbifer sp. VAAF005]|uniref:hypothetical protein n=1 Tax=Microbulbifer sp. VAAF005 TaxID=3034230 RepID=UPI0024AE5216|nr:hypothetical protein [Microbulbifer sp. VAAF005]WHI45752.1 hypothetical protein P0078_18800 [Microbulbifer sp. VAAF005]